MCDDITAKLLISYIVSYNILKQKVTLCKGLLQRKTSYV